MALRIRAWTQDQGHGPQDDTTSFQLSIGQPAIGQPQYYAVDWVNPSVSRLLISQPSIGQPLLKYVI